MQLQWDCSQNEGTTRLLIDSWIATIKSHSGTILDQAEQRAITNILRMETSQVIGKIESLLRMDQIHFGRVRSQLLPLLIAWEQVILEKERYGEEGLCIYTRDDKSQLSLQEFLLLFQTVYYRAQAGLTTLPITITMPSLPPVTKCDVTRLPMEMRAEILCLLPDLRILLDTILSHSSFYATYKEYPRRISLAIFRQRCSQVRRRNISGVFWELMFALRNGEATLLSCCGSLQTALENFADRTCVTSLRRAYLIRPIQTLYDTRYSSFSGNGKKRKQANRMVRRSTGRTKSKVSLKTITMTASALYVLQRLAAQTSGYVSEIHLAKF